MRVLSAHQLGFLGGYLGLWHKIYLSDIFICLDTLQFNKHEQDKFENRQRIKTHTGWQWLVIPCKSAGIPQKLCSVQTPHDKWIDRHIEILEMNYKPSEYIQIIYDLYDSYSLTEWLSDINWYQMKLIADYLGIKTNIIRASDDDFYPKDQKNEMILGMCQKYHADIFIFGPKGKDYADLKLFEDNGINIIFQEYQHPVYPQMHMHNGFIPNLSVLDLILNCGKDSLEKLLEGNIRHV